MSSNLDDLVEGLKRIRVGALINLVMWFLTIVILTLVMYRFMPFFGLSGFMYVPPPHSGMVEAFLEWMRLLIYYIIIDVFVYLLVTYFYWYKGSSYLSNYNSSKFSIGKTGIFLMLIGLISALPGLIGVAYLFGSFFPMFGWSGSDMGTGMNPVAFSMALFGIIFIPGVVGFLLMFLGIILFSIMLMRLGDEEGLSQKLKTSGILMLIAIILSFIPIASFVAGFLVFLSLVFMYLGAGESERNLKMP